ncbi:zinc dependent phospholipase C family protein [Thermincola ferriacetica]
MTLRRQSWFKIISLTLVFLVMFYMIPPVPQLEAWYRATHSNVFDSALDYLAYNSDWNVTESEREFFRDILNDDYLRQSLHNGSAAADAGSKLDHHLYFETDGSPYTEEHYNAADSADRYYTQALDMLEDASNQDELKDALFMLGKALHFVEDVGSFPHVLPNSPDPDLIGSISTSIHGNYESWVDYNFSTLLADADQFYTAVPKDAEDAVIDVATHTMFSGNSKTEAGSKEAYGAIWMSLYYNTKKEEFKTGTRNALVNTIQDLR